MTFKTFFSLPHLIAVAFTSCCTICWTRYLCSLALRIKNASHFLFLSGPSCPDVPLWLHLCQLWKQDKKAFSSQPVKLFFWRNTVEDGLHIWPQKTFPILSSSWSAHTDEVHELCRETKWKQVLLGSWKNGTLSGYASVCFSWLEDLLSVLLRNSKGSRQQHLLFGRKPGVTDCSTNACYEFSSWWGTIFLWSRTTGCCRSVELWWHEQWCQLFSCKLSASKDIIRRNTEDIVWYITFVNKCSGRKNLKLCRLAVYLIKMPV